MRLQWPRLFHIRESVQLPELLTNEKKGEKQKLTRLQQWERTNWSEKPSTLGIQGGVFFKNRFHCPSVTGDR